MSAKFFVACTSFIDKDKAQKTTAAFVTVISVIDLNDSKIESKMSLGIIIRLRKDWVTPFYVIDVATQTLVCTGLLLCAKYQDVDRMNKIHRRSIFAWRLFSDASLTRITISVSVGFGRSPLRIRTVLALFRIIKDD